MAGDRVRRRAIRRTRAGPVTVPVSGPGWVTAPSCQAPDAAGQVSDARCAARQGLCRRGIRQDAVRPGRRARHRTHRLLRGVADTAAGGPVRIGGRASRATWTRYWPCPPWCGAGRSRCALTVRARRGVTAAHYENAAGAGTIAVPDRRPADWAMRELVVLHEVAHHLQPGRAGARAGIRRYVLRARRTGDGPRSRACAAGCLCERGREW